GAFVAMEALPLSRSGKVDERALPEPEVGAVGAGYEEPRDEVERALAEVWGEVLGVERVGIEDDFFELGGDSIVSIQVEAGEGEREAVVERLQRERDLGRDPMLRAGLLRGEGGEDVLVMDVHHLVVDGVSWRVLVGDLERALRGERVEEARTSYREWAEG